MYLGVFCGFLLYVFTFCTFLYGFEALLCVFVCVFGHFLCISVNFGHVLCVSVVFESVLNVFLHF